MTPADLELLLLALASDDAAIATYAHALAEAIVCAGRDLPPRDEVARG